MGTPWACEPDNESSSKNSHSVVRHLKHNQDRRTYTTKLRELGSNSNSNPNSLPQKLGRSSSNSKNSMRKLKNRFPRIKPSFDDLTYDAEDERGNGLSSSRQRMPRNSFTPCGFDIDELKEHALMEDEQYIVPCDASPKSQADHLQQSDTLLVSEHLSPRSSEVVSSPPAVSSPDNNRGSIKRARDSLKLKNNKRSNTRTRKKK